MQSFGHRRTRSSKQATADKHHAARQGEQRCRAGTIITHASFMMLPEAATAVMLLAAPLIKCVAASFHAPAHMYSMAVVHNVLDPLHAPRSMHAGAAGCACDPQQLWAAGTTDNWHIQMISIDHSTHSYFQLLPSAFYTLFNILTPLPAPTFPQVFNFSAGPAILPLEVLEQAQSECLNFNGSGMSVMEMSHRSKAFDGIIKAAEADLRQLLSIPDNYKVLFVQGGASTQFAAIPLNFTQEGEWMCGGVMLAVSGGWSGGGGGGGDVGCVGGG